MPIDDDEDIEVDQVPSRPLSPMEQLNIIKSIEMETSFFDKDPHRRDLEVIYKDMEWMLYIFIDLKLTLKISKYSYKTFSVRHSCFPFIC